MRGALILSTALLTAIVMSLLFGEVRMSPQVLWHGLTTGE